MAGSRTYDAIVVGVGAVGSAVSYFLADRGFEVLGLEQYDIPHHRGSSHGVTRTLSLVKSRGAAYVPVAQRARELWLELEGRTGRSVFTATGSVRAWPASGAGHRGTFETARDGLDVHSVPYEVVSGAELNERFPAFSLPGDHRVIFQPDGGFLDTEACISGYVEAAMRAGGVVRAREPVRGWEATGEGVRVVTGKDTYEAEYLVVTAGAWAGQVVDVLSNLMTPERRVMAWLQPTEPAWFMPEAFPAFSVDVEEGYYYGTAVHRVPGFKFGRRPRIREVVRPGRGPRTPTPQDEEVLRGFAERYLPAGAGPTMRLVPCIVTDSPDAGFVIDRHPAEASVVFGAGFSGSGFHVASAVGELLADLVEGTDPVVDPAPFRLDRFGDA